jgi:hypothetical protein
VRRFAHVVAAESGTHVTSTPSISEGGGGVSALSNMIDLDRANPATNVSSSSPSSAPQPSSGPPGEMFIDSEGREFVGAGRTSDEKDITSPYPFLDLASRLIIQLAEAND